MKKKTTPQLLADAMLALSEKKDVDKIKIKEIVEYCGLSSQTFYNHFSDKYDLILWIHKSAGDELVEKMERGDYSFRDMTVDNLRFYSDHAVFMLNALANTHGQDSYLWASTQNAIDVLTLFIKRKYKVKQLTEKEAQHLKMYVYATVAMYAEWAREGMVIPIETMADYIVEFMPDSLKPYFP